MRIVRGWLPILVAGGTFGITGCGGSLPEALVSIDVTPVSSTATSGTSTDKVQFTATGHFGPLIPSGCIGGSPCVSIVGSPDKTQVLTNAIWTTADVANTAIDSGGLAVCLSATPGPVKVTASAPGYNTTIRGSATLTCN